MARSTKGIGGVPLTYTPQIGEEIARSIATSSLGIKKLCAANKHWPCHQTIFEWRIKVPEFGALYTEAKRHQIEFLIDEVLDIADDASHDTIIKTSSTGFEYESCNTEWMNRSRLRIETRKWLAAKLAPRVYGDKKDDEKDNDDFVSRHRDAIDNE